MTGGKRLTLADYIAAHYPSYAAAARASGVDRETLRSYAVGLRRPREDMMRRLYLWSGGAIDPGSFFPVRQWRTELRRGTTDARAA